MDVATLGSISTIYFIYYFDKSEFCLNVCLLLKFHYFRLKSSTYAGVFQGAVPSNVIFRKGHFKNVVIHVTGLPPNDNPTYLPGLNHIHKINFIEYSIIIDIEISFPILWTFQCIFRLLSKFVSTF